jgi:hypothetical protein
MEMSNEINALIEALSKAQGEMGAAEKDSKNPFLDYKYSSLDAVIDACRPALSKNGLAVIQSSKDIMEGDVPKVLVTTMLAHLSGQWVRESISMPIIVQKGLTSLQSMGVSITYGRRYGITGMVMITSDQDVDGSASEPEKPLDPEILKKVNELKAAGKNTPVIAKELALEMKEVARYIS